MKSERENLETTYTRVSRRLETCLRRKRDMQSCLTQNEALSDLRARVRFFFGKLFSLSQCLSQTSQIFSLTIFSLKFILQLWAWRGIYAEHMLGFFRAVRIVNEEKGTSSASMVLRTRQEVTRLRVGKLAFDRRRRLLRIVRSIRLLARSPDRALSQNAHKKLSDLNRFEPEEVKMHPLNSCEKFEPRSLLALLLRYPIGRRGSRK